MNDSSFVSRARIKQTEYRAKPPPGIAQPTSAPVQPGGPHGYGQPVNNPAYAMAVPSSGYPPPPPGIYGQPVVEPMEVMAEPMPSMMTPGPINSGVSIGTPELAPYPNLFVAKTKKDCCKECMTCGCFVAKEEFFVGTINQKMARNFYIIEDTSCINRFCCRSLREFEMHLFAGPKEDPDQKIATFRRPWQCGLAPHKCCCFQEIETLGRDGTHLGRIKETFWCCIPNFAVTNSQGEYHYNIHMPICCGCCPNVCAEGCCRYGFYIYESKGEGWCGTDDTSDQEVGKIVKVWAGMYNEVLADAHKFEINFPVGVDDTTKANLLGGTLLINQLFFEGKDDSGAN
jgi:hypothetical protein